MTRQQPTPRPLAAFDGQWAWQVARKTPPKIFIRPKEQQTVSQVISISSLFSFSPCLAIYRCTLFLSTSSSASPHSPLSLSLSACPCQNHKFYWPNCRANYAANKWPIMKPVFSLQAASVAAPTNWQSQHLSFPYRRDHEPQQELQKQSESESETK